MNSLSGPEALPYLGGAAYPVGVPRIRAVWQWCRSRSISSGGYPASHDVASILEARFRGRNGETRSRTGGSWARKGAASACGSPAGRAGTTRAWRTGCGGGGCAEPAGYRLR